MDCESYEYDMMLNDYENIKKFRELIFKYYGDPKQLLKILTRELSM